MPKPEQTPNILQTTSEQLKGRLDSSLTGAAGELGLPPRHEFAHERVQLSMDFCPVQRVTYLGGKREQFVARMDKLLGDGNWTIGYVAGGKMLSRDEALNLYEHSYVEYFKKNPEFTQRLVREARDVYDTNPSNVESGLDWHKQEDSHSHLQDIAVRRALKALGLSFHGDKLLQIRGQDSDLPELNPGRVPFIAPELIDTCREFHAQWVQAGSVEDFWQNNKFVFVSREGAGGDRLKSELVADLAANRAQNWKLMGERLRTLVLIGEASPEMVEKFVANIVALDRRKGKGVEIPESYITKWARNIQDDMRYVLATAQLSLREMLKITDPLMVAMVAEDPEVCSMYLGAAKSSELISAYFTSLMNHLRDNVWHGKLEILNVCLRHEPSLRAFEVNPVCREVVKRSAVMELSEQQIRDDVVQYCRVPPETKERFLAALKSIREDPRIR